MNACHDVVVVSNGKMHKADKKTRRNQIVLLNTVLLLLLLLFVKTGWNNIWCARVLCGLELVCKTENSWM